MRKIFKRITSFIMMATMAVGMTVATVNAADAALKPDTGNLYIHRYAINDIANAGLPNDGTEATLPDGVEALSGITFKVYEVDTSSNYPSSGAVIVNSMSNTTSFTDSKGRDFEVTLSATKTTDTAGLAKAENLPKGVYLVVEQESDKVATPSAPYIVSVPMTDGNGNGWLTDVHTYPKNGDISVVKSVSNPSTKIGDTVTWTIATTTGSTTDGAEKYNIIDEMDTALTYVPGSVKVVGVAGNGTESVIAASNYDVSFNEAGNVLTVSFNASGLNLIPTYASVKITFDTVVNSNILNSATNSIGNKADLEFTNKYGQDKDRTSSTVKEHTASIKVVKSNTDGAKLGGAKFRVATTEANAKAGRFLKIDNLGNIIDYGEAGYDNAGVWELSTDSNGVATFSGLADLTGGNYQSYYVVETQAPDGYSLVGEPIAAAFTATNSTEGSAYTITLDVVDERIPILPQTGGNGTWMFFAAGISIIALAFSVILIGGKRKGKKQTN